MREQDTRELDAQLEAIHRLGGCDLDISVLRKLLMAEQDRLDQAHAAFQAAVPGAQCSRWMTIECSTVGGATRQIIASGPERRTPIAWGGGSCFSWGQCRICLHWECRQSA